MGPGPGPQNWRIHQNQSETRKLTAPFTNKSAYLLVNHFGVPWAFLFGFDLKSPKKPHVLLSGASQSIPHLKELNLHITGLSKASGRRMLYPEVYVMEGGYEKFYDTCVANSSLPKYCIPETYRPMKLKVYEKELKQYVALLKNSRLKVRKILLYMSCSPHTAACCTMCFERFSIRQCSL